MQITGRLLVIKKFHEAYESLRDNDFGQWTEQYTVDQLNFAA